jgi:FAD/FMN-containing dehydrogenase/ferredoxin
MKSDEFRKIVGDIVILEQTAEREIYSHDIGDLPPIMTKMLFKTLPDFVVQPRNMGEIQKVLEFAINHKIPVVPRGAASWGLGGVVPTNAGIVIDLSPLRNISNIDIASKTITLEAGVRWSDIDIMARKQGLCLMTYPSSKFSTVGGWISTGGYGINSFKYGHVSQQIISMTVVTSMGEVKRLSPSDHDFKYFISTEGMFGIIVEVTLCLRDIPQGSYPHLLYFQSDREAFEFLDRYVKIINTAQFKPNFIRFLNENHLADINEVTRTNIFWKKAAVLLEFGNSADEEQFTKYMTRENNIEEAPYYVASYLWNERLFGMRTKRLGPTILASEIVMPIASTASFIAKAKKIGSYFGVSVSIDSFILNAQRTLIMSTFLCDSRKLKYYVNIPLVSMLTWVGIAVGAQPYGLGIWNAAFIRTLYNKSRERELKVYKMQVDPYNIMNPGKSFFTGSKRLPVMIFNPAIFIPLIRLLLLTAPGIGKIVTILLGKDRKVDNLDYELSIHACAKCGNCIAVCPAYLVTHDEIVTAKGKIAIAKKILDGHTVTQEIAAKAFLCMHCRACEEVCETNLELMMLWDALEKRLEGKYGRPEAQIVEFIQKVDSSKEYWDMVEQNN